MDCRLTGGPSKRPSLRSANTICATFGEGQPGSATHRPERYSYELRGGAVSWIQTRSIGSLMMPLSDPLSQWSHQRIDSCRKPIAGPGFAVCG